MADNPPSDAWQFSFVTVYGDLDRIYTVAQNAPLATARENLPINSNAGTVTNPLIVTGPYIRVSYALPSNISGAPSDNFTFDGRIKLVRKAKEFPRDIDDGEVLVDTDVSLESYFSTRDEYLEELVLLDHVNSKEVYYYTIFYGNALTGKFAFSPLNSHSRNFAFTNILGPDGNPYSKHGEFLFDPMIPRQWRVKDYLEANNTTYRLLQILGRMYDSLKDEWDEQLQNGLDIDNCDASKIPYIDWLLAWPTNYELPEIKRRLESRQATSIWKIKSRADAIETVLQTITGWDVTVYEGFNWIIHSNRPAKDPAMPPPGWVDLPVHPEGEYPPPVGYGDGIWADLVNAEPIHHTIDFGNPLLFTGNGTNEDLRTYTPDFSVISNNGIGWWWQNQNGLLIVIEPVPGVSTTLQETVVRKVARMTPLFTVHYATFNIQARLKNSEQYQPLGNESYTTTLERFVQEQVDPFVNEVALDVTPDRCILYSYPSPEYPLGSVSNSEEFNTWHSWLEYGCESINGDLFMPQYLTLANGLALDHTFPGPLHSSPVPFDPTEYAGTRQFEFVATISTNGPTPGTLARVRLWNVTDDEEVASTIIATSSDSPQTISSGTLTVGSAAGNLKDGLKLYEVRFELDGSLVTNDFAHLASSFIKVI